MTTNGWNKRRGSRGVSRQAFAERFGIGDPQSLIWKRINIKMVILLQAEGGFMKRCGIYRLKVVGVELYSDLTAILYNSFYKNLLEKWRLMINIQWK